MCLESVTKPTLQNLVFWCCNDINGESAFLRTCYLCGCICLSLLEPNGGWSSFTDADVFSRGDRKNEELYIIANSTENGFAL